MTTADQARSLARIRWRRRALVAALLLLPVLLLALPALPVSETARQVILLIGCALYSVATLLCVFSRCPRCRRLFHDVYALRRPFAGACRSCGLRLDPAGAP